MAGKKAVIVATVGQAVMRSDDDGKEWQRLQLSNGLHSDAIVRGLAVDPQRPENIFAGTDKGIYRSEDAGWQWKLMENPLNDYTVWKIAIDAKDTQIMYAGTGTPSPCHFFRSDDRGKSWERLPVEIADSCVNTGVPRFTGLHVEAGAETVWAAIEVDGVRYTHDSGQTWNRLDEAIPNPDIHALSIVEGSKTVVIATVNAVYSSADNGNNWHESKARDTFSVRQPRCTHSLASRPHVVFLGLGDDSPGRTGVIARSKDSGKTWEELPLDKQPNSSMWWIGGHDADPNLLYAVTRFGYLYRSDDGGDSWKKEWREFGHATTVAWVPM